MLVRNALTHRMLVFLIDANWAFYDLIGNISAVTKPDMPDVHGIHIRNYLHRGGGAAGCMTAMCKSIRKYPEDVVESVDYGSVAGPVW